MMQIHLLALASFFITTLVVNTISTEKIENIFTKDITILSYVFMAVSFGYLLLCNWEMKKYNIFWAVSMVVIGIGIMI
jgi:hypothetical protein